MPRADFLDVPYCTGDISVLRWLFKRSRTNHSRIAVFGTSLETHPDGFGDNYIPRLWANSYSAFGASSESVIGFNRNMAQQFGIRTANYSATTTATGAPPILPATVLNQTTGTLFSSHPQIKLQRTAIDQTQAQWVAGRQRYFEFEIDLKCEFWVVAHAGSPARVRYLWHPAANETGVISAATNLVQQVVRGTDYAALPSGTWVKEVTDSLAVSDSFPVPQITLNGRNSADNAVVAGLWPGGFRWLCNSDNPRGMSWNSFAFGGARISTMRAAADPAHAQFQAYGPWTAICLAFGINDIGSEGLTIEQYKSALVAYIEYLRSSPWNQQDVPIILNSQLAVDPAKTGAAWGVQTHADYRLVSAVHQEIAEEMDLVVAINERRAIAEAGYDPANPLHSDPGDGIHPTITGPFGGYWMSMRADRYFQVMQQSVAGQVGPTVIDILHGFAIDTTQTTARTNAATAATQATTAATQAAAAATSAVTAQTQTTAAAIKAAARDAVEGTWTDETNATFQLTITD
jgi:hypothetical protein